MSYPFRREDSRASKPQAVNRASNLGNRKKVRNFCDTVDRSGKIKQQPGKSIGWG